MFSAITVCLVTEARHGPFVYHEGLENACQRAAALGFDAIEIFPPSADALDADQIQELLAQYQLRLAAVGTGAGWVRHGWSLTASDSATQTQASEFIAEIIDVAGTLGAPAIIGSMQGRAPSLDDRDSCLATLGKHLVPLAEQAEKYGVPLLIEPLNRYETNLLNELPETARWIKNLPTSNLRILADLFHMNIEEADMAASIVAAGKFIGHVHLADSNRHAAGMGHAPLGNAIAALKQIEYGGYLSAEIFPKPDSDQAARQTIETFRQLTCVST